MYRHYARIGAILLAALIGFGGTATGQWDRLTSKPAGKLPPMPKLAVGEEFLSAASQKRKLQLSENITLLVNQGTSGKHTAVNEIFLSVGEVYVEAKTFTIKTGARQVRITDAKAAVRVTKEGTSVVVTRGEAKVVGVAKAIKAGFQLPAGATEPIPLPRASHVLDWTKDLLAGADSPLVPGSQYGGGALVARDPNGQEAKISLRKFHVDVHIEDGFARTTIDQTYFNEESLQLEGTFYFPLPADASLSRLAMYVDGNLMEGGMAERDYARGVYETIRYANRDPALLEWLDGTTFKMRVFPLEPRTEKRIILSYTQRLPSLYGQTQYRFPAGHSLQRVADWSVHTRVKGGAELAWDCPSHPLKGRMDAADLVLSATAKNAATDRDLVITLTEAGGTPKKESARFSSSIHENAQYVMLRFRPDLQIKNLQSKISNPVWVFLFESSGDRDPLLGRAQIEVIRHLLTNVDAKDNFLIAAASTRVTFHAKEPQTASTANIVAAVRFLENAHLIGALDLGSALEEMKNHLPAHNGEIYLVHVGSGIPAMGEKRETALTQIIEGNKAPIRYVGVGVGRRWNRAFMKMAAEKTGGHFTQINPDEPIAWRAFDLFATLDTPRLMNVTVECDGGAPFLVFNQSIAQGEEICAVAGWPGLRYSEAPAKDAKLSGDPGLRSTSAPATQVGTQKKDLPKSIVVRGLLDGKPVEYKLPVKDVAALADYLPRTWAKLEIERLLAEDALKHKDTIIALSKSMYVITPFTSLLVLEHEDLYAQYKVDRGRKDHWAIYPCPDKIPVIYEPLAGQPDPKGLLAGKKQKADYVVQTVLARSEAEILRRPSMAPKLEKLEGIRPGFFFSQGGGPIGTFNGSSDRIQVLAQVPALEADFSRFSAREFGVQLGIQERVLYSKGKASTMYFRDGSPLVVGDSQDFFGWRGFSISGLSDEKREIPLVTGSTITATGLVTSSRAPPQTIRQVAIDSLGVDLPPFGFPFIGDEDLRHPQHKWRRFWEIGGKREEKASTIFLRPDYASQDSHFSDLLTYAPGMNSTYADLEAVLDKEALPSRVIKKGDIELAARNLLDKARLAGWHTWTIPGKEKQASLTITLDGAGRFDYERTLPLGIKERVICDGQTLVHLYPQLHIGAKRTVSRFHRADFAEEVPWYLPPAEDMAHGVDLKVVAERTVALVPHFEAKVLEKMKEREWKDASWLRQHLVFGADGKLAERQLVKMPDQQVVMRLILSPEGSLRVLDKDGKEVTARQGKLTPGAQAPELAPDTKGLVVLPLPYRSAEHVQRALKNKSLDALRLAEALPLFAAHVGAGNGGEALKVFKQCFHAREQRQLGYYVLLAASGVNLDSQNADVLAEYLDEPLAQYLALHSSPVLRKHASQWAVGTVTWNEGFLQHLSQTHALYQKWQNEKIAKGDPDRVRADRQKALAYVRAHKDSTFGFAMLCLVEDRAGKDKEAYRDLAEAWRLFEDSPAMGYAARYEVARCLYKSGQIEAARKQFQDVYAAALKDGALPAFDQDFRWALVGKQGESDTWNTLMRDTANQLIKDKHRPAALALAQQVMAVGDAPLAGTLAAMAVTGSEDAKEKTALTLAGIQFLAENDRVADADASLRELLADKEQGQKPGLWRLALRFADERALPDRALECLEKALDVEFHNLPETVDLEAIRADYGRLLDQYGKLAEAMVILKVKPAPDFLKNVVRVADRWRALDRDHDQPSIKASWIMKTLGDRELGWDYLTTPLSHKPSEADAWLGMASALAKEGNLSLAERAYQAAAESEPTNAQILWDRAQNLRRAGKEVEAQPLFRRIAEGAWQPRFQGLVNQARGEIR